MEVGGEPFRLLEGQSCQEVWDNNFGKKLPWIQYVGFKLFYYHPEDSEDKKVWDLLDADKDVKIIHIRRENMLRAFVSKKIAKKTGAWNSRQQGMTVKTEDKRVTINIEECLEEFHKTKSLEAKCAKDRFHNHDYMEMTYEEFVADIPQQFSNVLNFLGIAQIEVKAALKRQNPEAVQDLVANYQEVQDALIKTEFGYLVEDTPISGRPIAAEKIEEK